MGLNWRFPSNGPQVCLDRVACHLRVPTRGCTLSLPFIPSQKPSRFDPKDCLTLFLRMQGVKKSHLFTQEHIFVLVYIIEVI